MTYASVSIHPQAITSPPCAHLEWIALKQFIGKRINLINIYFHLKSLKPYAHLRTLYLSLLRLNPVRHACHFLYNAKRVSEQNIAKGGRRAFSKFFISN